MSFFHKGPTDNGSLELLPKQSARSKRPSSPGLNLTLPRHGISDESTKSLKFPTPYLGTIFVIVATPVLVAFVIYRETFLASVA
jgi:hypothetical protein